MRLSVVGVVVVASLVAGCGGGSSSSSKSETRAVAAPTAASPAPPTGGGGSGPPSAARKRFIRKADRVCAAGRRQLTPIRTRALKASLSNDPAVVYRRYATLTGQAATIYGAIVGQLRGLDPPPADQAEIDRLTALLDQTAGIERQISAAAARQDGARVRQLALEVNGVVGQFRAGAKAYGFHACASTAGAAVNRRGNR